MKNAIIRKILAAAAALMVAATLSGCFAAPAAPDEGTTPPAATGTADTSGSDAVSGADVSGSDVVVDDETAANNAIDAYFACFNTGNSAGLADLTCSPAISSFLVSNGYSKDFIAQNYASAIGEMKAAAGGSFDLRHEYTVVADDEKQIASFKADLSALSAGAGDKVQAVRVYQVTMKSVAVSGTDVQVLDQSDCVLIAYKYDGAWYVHSN